MSQNYRPDPEKIARAVKRSKTKAEEYLKDPDRSKRLLDEAMKKAKNNEKLNGPVSELWQNLKTLSRLLKAYFDRDYTNIPWGSIVLIVGAIIYFVSPIDLMPDWIPLAGFVDDAAVLVFVIAQVRSDLEKFTRWEDEKNRPTGTGDVIDISLK